nr:Amino acid transporter domain containing protein [Haemonchus contortus]
MSIVEKEKLLFREHGISSSATYNLINFLNGMIGPGCFSVAMAFKQGGLWMSFFLVFFLGGISTISMMKIVKCSQHLSRMNSHTYLDYGDMAESAFGSSACAVLVRHKSKAKYFVNGCLIAFQVGVASVAYVFVVEHIQEILQHFNVGTSLTTKELLLLYTIPTILINFELFTSEHHWKELPWVTSFDGVVASAGSLLYSFEGQAMVR